MSIILATSNPGKLREIREVLGDLDVELLSPEDLGEKIEIEETGETFEENAILKAQAYVERFGLAAVGDDGGLEIDALGGEPGVRSHRWPGYEATDEELIGYTLGRMYGIPMEERGAQFRVVGAFVTPEGDIITEEEKARGIIMEIPTRVSETGYPYRTIFYLTEFQKCFSEITEEEHAQINHRLKMLKRLKARIESLISKP